MALVTANGLTAYDFQLRRPRIGAWHADMLVDSAEELTGRIDLVIDDGFKTLRGTAVRHGEFAQAAHLRVVGGNAGLGVSGVPKHYNATTVGIVLRDLLRTAGESLSSTADLGVLGTRVASWTTTAIPVGASIGALVQAAAPAGTAWRVLADGTVWVGPETWPSAGLDEANYQIIDEPFEEGSILINVDRPSIEPGTTFEDRRVDYVQDDVPQAGPVQTRVWFLDDSATGVARARASLEAIANAARPRVDYRAMYWCRVISQSASGDMVDVQPEDSGVPDMGAVPLTGTPGHTASSLVGSRVLVGWSWPELRAYALAVDLSGQTGLYPTIVLNEAVIAWLAAVGTGSSAGPPPATIASLIARVK